MGTEPKVLWRTGMHDSVNFPWLYLNLNAVRTNLVPGQFGHSRQIKQVGIIVK